MKNRLLMVAGAIIGTFFIGSFGDAAIIDEIEKPKYEVVDSSGDIEIRRYEPMIIAEVSIAGDRKESLGSGFRILADYIFGENIDGRDIAMTAPVQQQRGVKIPMTAPVQQQYYSDVWRVSFVMPSKYSMATLPKPLDWRIAIKQVPAQEFAVIVFSGMNSQSNFDKHENELREYIRSQDLSVVTSPKYAFYNPPWSFPPLRRNEVLLEIKG